MEAKIRRKKNGLIRVSKKKDKYFNFIYIEEKNLLITVSIRNS